MATKFDRAKDKRLITKEIETALHDEININGDLMDLDIYGDDGDNLDHISTVLTEGSDKEVMVLCKLLSNFQKN